MKKIDNKTVITLLIILLSLALIYIAVDETFDFLAEQNTKIFNSGLEMGYQRAVLDLINELESCQPVPIYANNLTVNAIAIECLQQTSDSIEQENI